MSDIGNETLTPLETLRDEALAELLDSGLRLSDARRVAEKLAKQRYGTWINRRAEAEKLNKDLPPDAFD